MNYQRILIIEDSQNDFEDIMSIFTNLYADADIYPSCEDPDVSSHKTTYVQLIDDVHEILKPVEDDLSDRIKAFQKLIKNIQPTVIVIDVLLFGNSEVKGQKGDFLWEKYIQPIYNKAVIIFLTEKNRGTFSTPQRCFHIYKKRAVGRLNKEVITKELEKISKRIDSTPIDQDLTKF